ncbi:MAG: hypothetical protein ACPGJV_12395 [Bacteriovoracaceae bacterium]
MDALNEWTRSYQFAKRHFAEGDMNNSYRSGLKCWGILRDTFNRVDDEGQIYLLGLLYKTAMIVFKSVKETRCRHFSENQLFIAMQNYRAIIDNPYYYETVQARANQYYQKVSRALDKFRLERSKKQTTNYQSHVPPKRAHIRLV